MKKFLKTFLVCLGFLLILTACKGSKQIQGRWKAQDSAGTNVMITVSKDTIKIGDETYDYTQNIVGFKNSTRYYGLIIDKQLYSFIIPSKKKDVALLLQPDSEDNYLLGSLVYAMDKNTYPDYQEYVTDYLK